MTNSKKPSKHDLRSLIDLILTTLELHDPFMTSHAEGVSSIAAAIARNMEWEDDRLERLKIAGLLHDIGKIAAPKDLIVKAGRLTKEEFEKLKEHSQVGYEILKSVHSFKDLALSVRHHHEHYDGSGYPDGLSGKDIPLESRILCAADTVEAMTTNRPYRKALSLEMAYDEVNRLSGTQFCPYVVSHLNEIRDLLEGVESIAGFDERARKNLTRTVDMSTLTHPFLDQLEPGDAITVGRVGGDPEFRRRLLELGVVPGVKVKMVRVAPMGDPVEIEIRGANFTLRKAEAAKIRGKKLSLPKTQKADNRKESDRERSESGEPKLAPLPNAPASRSYNVAVAGIPNTGKTTLFNALTGGKGKVGNYPGITVDRLVGKMRLANNMSADLVDVPGTYSLTARSSEEQVAIDELLGRAGWSAPDLVIVVLNPSTMERSLYLLMQIQELGYPILAAVNMMDEAAKKRIRIDLEELSSYFGIPFVGVSAISGHRLEDLRNTIQDMLTGEPSKQTTDWHWEPSSELLKSLDAIIPEMGDMLGADALLGKRRAFALWSLMSISEDDDLKGIPDHLRTLALKQQSILKEKDVDLDLEVSRSRYAAIDKIIDRYVESFGGEGKKTATQRIDSVLTHPVYGMLAFLFTMGLVFAGIFDWSEPAMEGIEWAMGSAASWVQSTLPEGILADVIADGIIAGVGSVLVFLPQILVLFFFIGLLESSGYMARIAFMIDRLMQKIGINGKAFVPMLSGFACAIPAIMATRTLEKKRDKLLTMMVIPLFSCSARLPVYTLIIAALFPANKRVLGPIGLGVLMLMGLYILSTILALTAAAVLGRTVFKGKAPPLLLELPPYRFPSLKAVGRMMSERVFAFLKTAGTVILIASIIIWFLLNYPKPEEYSKDYEAAVAVAKVEGDKEKVESLQNERHAENVQNSMAGRLGRLMEPIIEPLGFDWKIGIGLVGAFAAREVFVSTLGQVYAVGDATEESKTLRKSIREQRRSDGSPVYTPLTGLSILVFFMLSLQCVSTIAIVKQESGSWKWAGFQLLYMTVLSYVGALLVFQGGRLLGFS